MQSLPSWMTASTLNIWTSAGSFSSPMEVSRPVSCPTTCTPTPGATRSGLTRLNLPSTHLKSDGNGCPRLAQSEWPLIPAAIAAAAPTTAPCPLRAPPAKHLRLHGAIARMLGIAILSGQFGPGELFDGEIAASQSFAVSRSAYREAVRILAAKGLIEARPRAGTRVTPKAQWNLLDPDILLWAFAAEPDPVLLERLFELRSVVESTAAGFAAKRRSAAQLKAMWAALERMAMHTLA